MFELALSSENLKSPSALQDPGLPIVPKLGSGSALATKQRLRRARILASIRRLLTREGLEGVTMRGIAQDSRYAVQTIYNLVGPREDAIVEAISEYTRHVGLMAVPDPDDPHALLEVIDHWVKAVEAAPDFCRQVCLIYFTPSRSIFYHFREQQLKAMQLLLARQRRRGLISAETDVRDLAEQLNLHSTALCVEWSDCPFPLDQLHRRLCSAFAGLLSGAVPPEHSWVWAGLGSRG